MAVSPSGSLLALAHPSHVRLLQLAVAAPDGKKRQAKQAAPAAAVTDRAKLRGHASAVRCMAFSPDDALLARCPARPRPPRLP